MTILKCSFLLFFLGCFLIELPDEILVEIFSYLSSSEILRVISKVCLRFLKLIETNICLYRCISFEDSFPIDETVLRLMTLNPKNLVSVDLAFQNFKMDSITFNECISDLQNAHDIKLLDLSESPVSDLLFLKQLKSLEVLNLSSTKITDSELKNMQNLSSLTHLYLAFNNLQMSNILDLLKDLKLIFLDVCGTTCTYEEFLKALSMCDTLKGMHLSFSSMHDHRQATMWLEHHLMLEFNLITFSIH